MDTLRCLRAQATPVVIRIDPLFPRSPSSSGASLEEFGVPEAQVIDDLEHRVAFAARVQAHHVAYLSTKSTRLGAMAWMVP